MWRNVVERFEGDVGIVGGGGGGLGGGIGGGEGNGNGKMGVM